MKVLRSFETSVALSVDTTYSTFQKTSIFSNTAVIHCRLIITHQPCRVVAFLKLRLPNTIVVRWVTINSLQRSQRNLASDNPEAESTSPFPGRAEVYQVVAPSCLGATPTHRKGQTLQVVRLLCYGVFWFLYPKFQRILVNHLGNFFFFMLWVVVYSKEYTVTCII